MYGPPASDTSTATAPDGTVHTLDDTGQFTVCGEDAASWSRHVTEAQRAGLVVFCPLCEVAA